MVIKPIVRLFFIGLAVILCSTAAFCAEDTEEGNGTDRYQIYANQSFMVMLDTQTGKIWKITPDLGGKLKAEGITVEGLAYISSELESLNMKLKDTVLEKVSDKYKTKCKDSLISQFSYALDEEKINKVIDSYKESK